MANILKETARILSGETGRSKQAQAFLEQFPELLSQLSPELTTIISEAAGRGSTNFLETPHTQEEIQSAEKVADLFVNGGFIALPYISGRSGIEGGLRYHDASILPMTQKARDHEALLPKFPAYIGGFSYRGHDDTTGNHREKFSLLGIEENDLPPIGYQKTVHAHARKNQRIIGYDINIPFEYRLYYVPPGSQRALGRNEIFKDATYESSEEIMGSLYGATGRELTGRHIDTLKDPHRYTAPLTVNWRGPKNYTELNRMWERQRHIHDTDQEAKTILDNELGRAKATLDPLISDVLTIGQRVFFPHRHARI